MGLYNVGALPQLSPLSIWRLDEHIPKKRKTAQLEKGKQKQEIYFLFNCIRIYIELTGHKSYKKKWGGQTKLGSMHVTS